MRLELPIRWNETDKDSEKYSELTNGKVPSEPKYTYGKLSIDSNDIGPYYDIDDKHIMINDKNGKIYCVAVPFNDFKRVFTEVTGQAIMAVRSSEDYKDSRSKRKPPDNGISDDISKDILGD